MAIHANRRAGAATCVSASLASDDSLPKGRRQNSAKYKRSIANLPHDAKPGKMMQELLKVHDPCNAWLQEDTTVVGDRDRQTGRQTREERKARDPSSRTLKSRGASVEDVADGRGGLEGRKIATKRLTLVGRQPKDCRWKGADPGSTVAKPGRAAQSAPRFRDSGPGLCWRPGRI